MSQLETGDGQVAMMVLGSDWEFSQDTGVNTPTVTIRPMGQRESDHRESGYPFLTSHPKDCTSHVGALVHLKMEIPIPYHTIRHPCLHHCNIFSLIYILKASKQGCQTLIISFFFLIKNSIKSLTFKRQLSKNVNSDFLFVLFAHVVAQTLLYIS